MNAYSTQCIDQDDVLAVAEALKGACLTQGPLVVEFEHALESYLGVKHVLVCSNATSALFLIYQALELNNHLAITTPISFVATSNMLLANHAQPLFCDVKEDGNLNEGLLEHCYATCPHQKRIQAVVSVDYGGKSVEAKIIRKFCAERGLVWVSDSSHALGGSYHGQKIGALADVSVFSLHAIKPITTAEGGVITTHDTHLYQKLQLLREHGIQRRGFEVEVGGLGYNFRMNELQAALGLSQLKKLDAFIAIRQEIACFYDKLFANNPYFSCLHASLPEYIQSSNHLYPILLKSFLWKHKTQILQALLDAQIGIQVHYKPIHLFKLYQERLGALSLPHAEAFYQSEISLPCHQKMSLALAKHTADMLFSILERFGAQSEAIAHH